MATVILLNSMYFYVTAASGAICRCPEYDTVVPASAIIVYPLFMAFVSAGSDEDIAPINSSI